MRVRPLTAFLAALGGVALLAAACAPAAEPAQTTPAGGAQPPQAEPKQPEAAKPEAKPETKPETKPSEKAAVPPGEVDAKYGGVLLVPNSDNPPGYLSWEEAIFTAFVTIYPQTNNIVQYQTWGSFEKQDYWNVVGDLAKSWEQSADGLKRAFRLNDGVMWPDGQPFTCTDAQWSLDTIRTGQDLRRSPRALHLRAIDRVECADRLTLVVTLKRPQAAFLQLLAGGPNVIHPKHAYQGTDNLAKYRGDPKQMGTGPFVLTEYAAGEKWVYQRKADYWKKPYPYVDGIEIRRLSSSAVAAALRAGRLDLSGTASAIGGGSADQLVKECKVCQFWPTKYTSIGFTPLQPNHQRPPWNTPAILEAISYGIDKKKMSVVCQGGYPSYDVAFLHPDTPYAIPKDRLSALPGFNLDDPSGNKAKARDALARAGYRPGELSLTLAMPSSATANIPCYTEDFEAIGIKMTPLPLEAARLYDVRTAGDFDVMVGGYLTAAADPDATFYEYFYSGSDRNYGRYSNPEVDRLIDLQSATLDFERRKQLVWQIEETLVRETAHLPVTMGALMPISSSRVRNFLPGPTCGAQGTCARYERVWLDQTR